MINMNMMKTKENYRREILGIQLTGGAPLQRGTPQRGTPQGETPQITPQDPKNTSPLLIFYADPIDYELQKPMVDKILSLFKTKPLVLTPNNSSNNGNNSDNDFDNGPNNDFDNGPNNDFDNDPNNNSDSDSDNGNGSKQRPIKAQALFTFGDLKAPNRFELNHLEAKERFSFQSLNNISKNNDLKHELWEKLKKYT